MNSKTQLATPNTDLGARRDRATQVSGMTAQDIYNQSKLIHTRETLASKFSARPNELPNLDGFLIVEMKDGVMIVLARKSKREDRHYLQQGRAVSAFVRNRGARGMLTFVDDKQVESLLAMREKQTVHTTGEASDIFQFYRELLTKAVNLGASDIHIFMINGFGNVVYEVHGQVIYEEDPMPAQVFIEMCHHLYNTRKTGGDGNWTPDLPRNGVDNLEINGEMTRWRFHSYPNEDEKHAHIVFRRNNITQPRAFNDIDEWSDYTEDTFKSTLLELGYLPYHTEQLLRMFTSPTGGIFVAGKTNSGKTTLLNHALTGLSALSDFQRIQILIEDVPELSVPRAARTPVSLDKKNSLTFSDAIKSALRRSASAITVGEIRAGDSGPAVVEAVLTGHLVVASIHTNNILSMLDRLEQLDVTRSFLSGSGNLAGLVWQRLLPTLCDHCKVPIDQDDPVYLRMAERYPCAREGEFFVRSHKDCPVCKGISPGRTVAAEIMDFPNAKMRRAIESRDEATLVEEWLEKSKREGGGTTVWAIDHGYQHAKSGRVSPKDIEAQLGRFDLNFNS